MMYFSRTKTLSILGVCVLGLLLCLPNLTPSPAAWLPWRQIHLGLDLRGGSYLLLEIDMRSVVRERLDSLTEATRSALLRAGIGYQDLGAHPAANLEQPDQVSFRLRDPGQSSAALAALRGLPQAAPNEYAVAESDGRVSLTLSEQALRERADGAVQQSIEIVRRRIDETGVADPQIARQGAERIVVQLPGVSNPERIKQLLGQTAKMTFHLVDESVAANANAAPPGDTLLPMQANPAQKLAIRNHVEVDGANLTDARAGQNPTTGEWVVNFSLDGIGARRFAETSRANIGHPFAIVLDNRVVSAPVIRDAITGGQGQITGHYDAQSATDFAVLLRAGALPAPLSVVEERSVGPELGADSIRDGALSLLVGLILVIGFMGIFYGLFGWYANACLLVNLVLITAILSLFGAVLTLPGMAGILLTLGMAVDANILINERIREEARNGRTPLGAMEHGFKRAFSTILDSNVTALLAHVMLFVFGTGPVRGFALTITIGIVTTLFTVTVLTRLLMVRWYATTRPALLPV